MGAAVAILAAAGISAAGSIYASSKQSKAASAAAGSQGEWNYAAMAMQYDFLRRSRKNIREAVDAGLIDLRTGYNMAIKGLRPGYNAIRKYAKLLKDPSSVMDRPGVEFQYEQGVEALQAGFSKTAGGGMSGPMVKAATEYGQNFASLALDRELGRLLPLIDIQREIANLRVGRGTSAANLRVGGASGVANITGQMVPGIAGTMMQQGNVAASNWINQANIQTGMISNLSSQFTDLAMLYATRPELFSGGGRRP